MKGVVIDVRIEVKDLSATALGDVSNSHWINHFTASYGAKPSKAIPCQRCLPKDQRQVANRSRAHVGAR
jgi:hypothetical protein